MGKIKKLLNTNTKSLIFVLITLFIVLISISSASSAPTVYVNTTGSDSNLGTIDSPYLTINKGIQSVDENGFVNIEDGIYTGENNTNITISQSMNIIGQSQTGTIINGTNTNWIFNITTGVNVFIKNLTFANGNATNFGGGAICNNGTLTVENCFFNNNTAGSGWGAGGAICNFGNLTVTESTFTNNKATGSGSMGGAICNIILPDPRNPITNTVTSCVFINNAAESGGAIANIDYYIMWVGLSNDLYITNTVIDCDFIANVANSTGGAIANTGNLTVTGSNFTANTATGGSNSGGGAISNFGLCNVIGSNFVLNIASNGGAIINYGYLTVTGSNFTNNIAVCGGAIFNAWIYNYIGNAIVTDCNFTENMATTSMDNNVLSELFDSVFGEMDDFLGSLSEFIPDFAFSLFSDLFSGLFELFEFLFGSIFGAMFLSGGGAIANMDGALVVDNCNFTANNASGSGTEYGGAIFNYGYSYPGYATVTDSNFIDNNADIGGAISNYAASLVFVMYDSITTSTVTRCIFNSNSAAIGGAIANDCVGGLYASSVTSNVIDSIFNNNVASGNGGALSNSCNVGTITSTVTNSNFTGNTATNGGAISNGGVIDTNIFILLLFGSGTISNTVTNSNFIGNIATGDGGAVSNYWITSTLTKNNFIGNIANNGGALYYYNSTGEIHFNRIVGNIALTSGNGLYCYNQTVNATNNWWGNNINPMTVPNLIYVDGCSLNTNPWVILTVAASPPTINNGGTSTITADLNHNKDTAGNIGTLSDHIPDGLITLDVPWGSFTNPGITHSIIMNTVNGLITATFYANEGAVNPLYNPVRVNATADGYTTNSVEAAYVTINKVANLSITKADNPDPVLAGNQLTYTITVTNNGPDYAENVQIQDSIPGILQNVTHDSFNLGTIDPGQSMTITINGTVPSSTLLGTIIINTATVTTTTTETDLAYNSVTATTNADTLADVDIFKVVDNARPDVGDIVTFTVTAHNYGPSDATNIQIEDIMPADFIDVIVTVSKGIYSGGVWTLNLTNGEEATFNLTGKVSAVMAGKNTTNNATKLSQTQTDPDTLDTANITIYVPKSDLYIRITSNNNKPNVGEIFTLTYKLGNNGPDDAENVTITITLPNGFVISQITGDGTWIINGNTITWTMANVTVGDPYLYIQGWAAAAGSYLFSASITSNTYNINTEGVTPITINAVSVVNPASNTIGMQETGMPLNYLILAVLMVISGFLVPKRK